MLLITLLILGGCGAIYLMPNLFRLFEIIILKRKCRKKKTISLTYDDGPSPVATLKLLELLQVHSIKATFFVLGVNIEKYPEVFKKIIEEGHEIGIHGFQHRHAWKTTPWELCRDIRECSAIVRMHNVQAKLFRPTYGKLTICNWFTSKRLGMKTGWWTIDSGDTHETLPATGDVVDRVVKNGGAVVLMHDFKRELNMQERDEYVYSLTKRLLLEAEENGLRVSPI